jgi:hypothetical protein
MHYCVSDEDEQQTTTTTDDASDHTTHSIQSIESIDRSINHQVDWLGLDWPIEPVDWTRSPCGVWA